MALKDGIYGLAVADALGVPFEFKQRGTFKCEGMTGFGTWNQEPGTFSDDTSMTLATCQVIKDKGTIDIGEIRKNFELWLYQGKFTPDGVTFDVGNTTAEALRTKKGLEDFYSNGNGSLMRILPLAFVDATDEDINQVSGITHNHEISKEACRIYVHLARGLIQGQGIQETLEAMDLSQSFCRLKSLTILGEKDIRSTGYVVDSLEAALWSLQKTTSYKEAVLTAINLGDDTDTVGAITGGLAGILYGYESIPKDWMQDLRGKTVIDSCLF